MSSHDLPQFTEPVGIFPLPNAVLLPGGILPLQIYEPRYRSMVEDALEGEQIIGMALLRPGFEAMYYTNRAEIHPVVCVGKIQECIQIPSGQYFINLIGMLRARIRHEYHEGAYREAMLEPMMPVETAVETDGEFGARHQLETLLADHVFDIADGIERARADVGRELPLSDLLDRIAALVLPPESVEVRQAMLEEMRILKRSELLLSELKLLKEVMKARHRDIDRWPRFGSMN